MLKREWGEKILDGHKTLEIRLGHCDKRERIGLCYSGTSSIHGFVDVVGSLGPFKQHEWCALRHRHCVPGEKMPYGGQHVWVGNGESAATAAADENRAQKRTSGEVAERLM